MPNCRNCGNELPTVAKYCPVCGAPVQTDQTSGTQIPSSSSESGLKKALWGERFVAWLIDIVILNFALFVLGAIFFAGSPFTLIRNEAWWAAFFNFTRGGLLFFLYWLFMDGVYGRSVGKMVMRIKVVRVNCARVSFGMAALESAGKAFILPLDLLLGYFLYPGRRQRIFNYLSETIVVHEE